MFLLIDLIILAIPAMMGLTIYAVIRNAAKEREKNLQAEPQGYNQTYGNHMLVPAEGTFQEMMFVQGRLMPIYKLQYSINGVRKIEQISEFHYKTISLGQMIPVVIYANGQSQFDINMYLQMVNDARNFSNSQMMDHTPEQYNNDESDPQPESFSYPISENTVADVKEEINEIDDNDPSYLGLDKNTQKYKRM